MKKFFSSMVISFIFFTTLCFAGNMTPGQMAVKKFKAFFKNRGVNVKLILEKDIHIKDLDLKNFKFVIIELSKGKRSQRLAFLTDGKYMIRGLEEIGKRENLISYYESLYTVAKVPFNKNDFILGNKNSKIKIVYFGDFQCPFCRRCMAYIEAKYKDKVAVYYKHYPLPFHKNAILLAKIYEAGKIMGFDLHKFVETVNGDKKKIMEELKKKIPANKWDKFKKTMEEKSIMEKIKKGEALGRKFGVRGTPTIFINGHRIGGCNPQLIDQLIKRAEK